MHVPSRTTRPVVISEARNGPTQHTVDRRTGTPVQYIVTEHRRTVYVTSTVSPDNLNPQIIDDLLQPEMFGSNSDNIQRHHRSRSDDGQEKQDGKRDGVPQPSPTSARHYSNEHRHPSLPTLRNHNPQKTPPNTPASRSRFSWTPARPRILFYHSHEPYYGFTNFSPHSVTYRNKRYPTSEHLFQSFKFQKHRPHLAEHIRTCSERPSIAFSEARRFQPEVRSDWMDVNIAKMEETLWHKFTQHQDLREELLATGDAELVENSDKDFFWGIGAHGKGRNELGKALERLRDQLRKT